MKKNETYKGFEIEYFVFRRGFNEYKVTIKKYRKVGTREEEYFQENIYTSTGYKIEARKEAHHFINNLKTIEWSSNGHMDDTSLPHFWEVRETLKEELENFKEEVQK